MRRIIGGIDIKRSEKEINIGDKIGRLTIIDRVENKVQPSGQVKKQYLCVCDCGNTKVIQAQNLRKGLSKSCGCLSKEIASKIHTKNNELFIEDNICYGITTNSNAKFYFDKEDLNKVKQFAWFEYNGYIATNNYKLEGYPKFLKLHRLIMDEKDSRKFVDHINHDTLDNTKENLRCIPWKNNSTNRKSRNKNNKSGYRNVCWIKKENAWVVQLSINGKNKRFGKFPYEELDKAGAFAEEMRQKYYGKFAGSN